MVRQVAGGASRGPRVPQRRRPRFATAQVFAARWIFCCRARTGSCPNGGVVNARTTRRERERNARCACSYRESQREGEGSASRERVSAKNAKSPFFLFLFLLSFPSERTPADKTEPKDAVNRGCQQAACSRGRATVYERTARAAAYVCARVPRALPRRQCWPDMNGIDAPR